MNEADSLSNAPSSLALRKRTLIVGWVRVKCEIHTGFTMTYGVMFFLINKFWVLDLRLWTNDIICSKSML